MFKLIFFLIGLAVAIVFSALNIGNTADISFGFVKMTGVPVFLSNFIAFLAGAVFTLPFAFYVSFGNRRKKKNISPANFVEDDLPDSFTPADSEAENE